MIKIWIIIIIVNKYNVTPYIGAENIMKIQKKRGNEKDREIR
jgi:hypothetical protein